MSLDPLPLIPGANRLGHAHLFRTDRMRFLRSAAATGPVARMRFLHRRAVAVSSPQTAHEVLVEHAASFEKSPGLRLVLRDLAGDGLFTSEGELWRRQRRLMSPLFHQSQLTTYATTMSAISRAALARMRDGESVDLAHEMMRITMAVVAATLFGADTDAQAEDIGDALTVALKWIDDSLASPALAVHLELIEATERVHPHVPAALKNLRRRIEAAVREPFLLPGRKGPQHVAAIRTLDARIGAMIDDRRASPSARADLLTRLLLARDTEGGRGEGMSDQQLRDEAMTLFVAGHETTANALAWSFYLLSRNPEARARVQAEADAFGPDGPSTFAPERLAYTTRVFKEALRLYPPLVVLGRRSLQPVTIGGLTIPARTLVFVNVYGVHTLPDVWPDPDRFDPERFLPEHEARRPKGAWMPFGVGPRVCIGNAFALMEGPIVLATLMRNARFEVEVREIAADAFATLRPKGGVHARVRRVPSVPVPADGPADAALASA